MTINNSDEDRGVFFVNTWHDKEQKPSPQCMFVFPDKPSFEAWINERSNRSLLRLIDIRLRTNKWHLIDRATNCVINVRSFAAATTEHTKIEEQTT